MALDLWHVICEILKLQLSGDITQLLLEGFPGQVRVFGRREMAAGPLAASLSDATEEAFHAPGI